MKKIKHKKSLGQNFLHDEDVLENIIDVSDISEDEVIIEIGPGEGSLTEKLVQTGAKIIAIEIDKSLINGLKERFRYNDNCTIITADIRKLNLPEFLEKENIDKYKVVANLPYYITSLIIRFFLESISQPTDMIIMVQKEVAERICAKSGNMSILAVSVQFYGIPKYLFTVKAKSFEPVPKVDSAIIRIYSIIREFESIDEKKFFKIVKSGFCARRKKLVNNLSNSLHLDKLSVEKKIESINLKPTVRAQELSVNDWRKLSKIF